MSVRKVLNRTFLTTPTAKHGYKSGSTTVGNFHKTHRNTHRKIIYTGEGDSNKDFTPANYATGTIYSNGFISMPIPQSELQYSWITGALANKGDDLSHGSKSAEILGYAAPDGLFSASSGYSPAITFASASSLKITKRDEGNFAIDPKKATAIAYGEKAPVAAFVKLNLGIRDPVSASQNHLGYPVDYDITYYVNIGDQGSLTGLNTTQGDAFVKRIRAGGYAAILNGLTLQRNGPYGWPTWKQIRTGEHPVARALVSNHTVSLVQEDRPTRYIRGSDTGSFYELQDPARYGTVKHYRESPVISKYKPVEQTVMHKSVPISVVSSYGNALCSFSNDELARKYSSSKERLTYDIIKDRPDDFIQLVCSETVYPSEDNVYSNKIRERTSFANNFWKDIRIDRTAVGADKRSVFGMTGINQSAWSLDANEDFSDGNIVAAANYGAADKKAGELQNNYVQVHNGNKENLTASALYARKHMLAATGSVVGYGSVGGVIDIPETRSLAVPAGSTTTLGHLMQLSGGNALWEADRLAGKIVDGTFVSGARSPWYNSYQDYAEYLRLKNKDFSIVPEFRISEHIDKYIVSSSNNFLADNSGAFSVFGIPSTSDVPNNSGSVEFLYNFFF